MAPTEESICVRRFFCFYAAPAPRILVRPTKEKVVQVGEHGAGAKSTGGSNNSL